MTTENSHKVKRRWRLPRFKLSTILVVVAIAAWSMACWPLYGPLDPFGMMALEAVQKDMQDGKQPDFHLPTRPDFQGFWGVRERLWYWRGRLFIERLAWPLCALAAFLAWKLTWKWIAARRKRRREVATA